MSSSTDRWFAWRTLFAITLAAVLLALGIANMRLRARGNGVEDGVLWADRAEGVTAVDVASKSPAAGAGVRSGDVIIGVNGTPVLSAAELFEIQRRSVEGTRLVYQLLRLGTSQVIEVALAP